MIFVAVTTFVFSVLYAVSAQQYQPTARSQITGQNAGTQGYVTGVPVTQVYVNSGRSSGYRVPSQGYDTGVSVKQGYHSIGRSSGYRVPSQGYDAGVSMSQGYGNSGQSSGYRIPSQPSFGGQSTSYSNYGALRSMLGRGSGGPSSGAMGGLFGSSLGGAGGRGMGGMITGMAMTNNDMFQDVFRCTLFYRLPQTMCFFMSRTGMI